MTTQLDLGTYPKTLVLRDGTQVHLRPLRTDDKARLLRFFERVPEEERFYLKENVTSPEVIATWTAHIDYERTIPIVAEANGDIVADATLHRSRSPARRHVGEVRVVVDPAYRERGLGGRLMRELIDIAVTLRLHKLGMELVEHREHAAIMAALSMGFRETARLHEWGRDMWGNVEDLVILELPLEHYETWWRY